MVKARKTSRKKSKPSPKKGKKKCPSGMIFNPETGNCVKKTGRVGRKLLGITKSKKKSKVKISADDVECGPDEIFNPKTGNCVKKSGRVGLKLLKHKGGDIVAKFEGMKITDDELKALRQDCPANKILNPRTQRCVSETGKIAQAIIFGEKTVPKKVLKKVKCKANQIVNPKSGRCINKDGKLAKKLMMEAEEPKSPVRIPRLLTTPKSSKWEIVSDYERGNCITRSKVTLREWQIKVVDYMKTHDSLLVVHGTGCGKTLTAIAVSQCYLDENPDATILFVGPAALLDNFRKELKKYGVKNMDRYIITSFDKLYSDMKNNVNIDCKKCFTIADEVHNLRNPRSKRYNYIMNFFMKTKKRLLLTATPFVNSLTDFIPLINLLEGRRLVGTHSDVVAGRAPNALDSQKKLRYFLNGRVDVVNCMMKEDFPEQIIHELDIPMSQKYFNTYGKAVDKTNKKRAFENPQYFHNGYRRAVNKTGAGTYYSEKIMKVRDIIKDGKCLIFSNWLEYGVDPLIELLEKDGVKVKAFTGKTDAKERVKMVKDFNKGKLDAMVITKAGGEGLDLKGVRSVVVLDPPWNGATLRQIIGRAVRYHSHIHLPEDERVVNVYLLALTVPSSYKKDVLKSGDKLLYDIIRNKSEAENVILNTLESASI